MTTLPKPAESATPETESAPQHVKSMQQPAWHVVLLSVFSLSIYLVFWFFKTTRDLKSRAIEGESGSPAEQGLSVFNKINPFWLTVALLVPTALGPLLMIIPMPAVAARAIAPLVPIVTLGFFAFIFHSIAKLGKDGSLLKNNPTFPAFCLAVAMAMLWTLVKLPSYFMLCFTLVSIPVAIAQHWLNDYWKRVEPADAAVRRSFSMGEILTLLIGSIPLTLIMLTP